MSYNVAEIGIVRKIKYVLYEEDWEKLDNMIYANEGENIKMFPDQDIICIYDSFSIDGHDPDVGLNDISNIIITGNQKLEEICNRYGIMLTDDYPKYVLNMYYNGADCYLLDKNYVDI